MICRKFKLAFLLQAGLFLIFANTAALAANPLTAKQETALNDVLANRLQSTGFSSAVGFISPDGTPQYLANNAFLPQQGFRIGSQTKTLAGTVIMQLADRGDLSLNDTIGALVNRYDVNLGGPLPGDSGNLTVRQLLNMSSHIPNYMGQTVPGYSQTLWDSWIGASYATLPGITHQTLSALGLSGYPTTFSNGATGQYSNTNIIVLSLIAEKIYEQKTGVHKDFSDILRDTVIIPAGLNNTSLAMTNNVPGVVTGYESGKPITDMDPLIPWTSGSVVSSVEDQLIWLRELTQNSSNLLSPEMFAQRLDPANSTSFLMGGMPLQYGYSIFTLDLTNMGIPTTLVGHGGSIAGYSSFSAWHQQANIGIVVNTASLSSIGTKGNFTNIPSETLLMNITRHLDFVSRGAEITDVTMGTTADLNPGASGGNFLIAPAVMQNDLVIHPSNRYVSYLDLENPDVLVNTSDPTLLAYGSGPGALLTSGHNVYLPAGARAEGHAPGGTMLLIEQNGVLTLEGEVAGYGINAKAVELANGGTLNAAPGSLLYAQGPYATALRIQGAGSTANLNGILASLDGDGLSVSQGTANLGPSGLITAYATGYAMDNQFNTVDPHLNASSGVLIENGGTLYSQGTISASAMFPWNGEPVAAGQYLANTSAMPGVASYGVRMLSDSNLVQTGGLISGNYSGISLDGAGTKNITLDNTFVSGGYSNTMLYSIKALQGAPQSNISAINGTLLTGNIDLGLNSGNSLSMANAGLMAQVLVNMPAIRGATTLNFGPNSMIIPLLNYNGALVDFSLPLTTGTLNASGTPGILNIYSKAVTLSAVHQGSEFYLQGVRDWDYYKKNSPNRSLGTMLDTMPAYSLSAQSTALFRRLELSSDVYHHTAQLQPHNLSGITLSQLRQAGSLRRSMDTNSYPLDGDETDWFAFGGIYGHFGNQVASGEDLDGYDLQGTGIMVGLGLKINSNWRSGAFFSYDREEQKYHHSSDELKDDITRFGLFTRYDGSVLSGFAAVSTGFHSVEDNRSVAFLDERMSTEYNALDYLISTALWHDFAVTDKFSVTPLFELGYINNHAESATESKNNISALKLHSATYDYLASSAGVDLCYKIDFADSGVLSLTAGASWWHQWLDRPQLRASLAHDPHFSFNTVGARTDNDLSVIRAGVSYDTLEAFSVSLDYECYAGKNTWDNNLISLSIGVQF